MSAVGIKFGGFDMQANGVIVITTDVYSTPNNEIQADELAEADGALIVKQRYTSKPFKVEGYIQKPTRLELDIARDAFTAALSAKNQPFDIDYAGGIRRYLASAQNIMIGYSGATTYSFSVEFLSPDGMGWDLDSSSLITALNVTTASFDQPITVGGSYMAEPVIAVNLGSVTGGTTKTITLTNGVSLRGVSITRTWDSGDVLEVDSLKKTVFVNDIATDFFGQFPAWKTGAGFLGYLDDFTTRSVTINTSYTKRWL